MQMANRKNASQQRLVWDLPTRITHWSLAVCVPLAWLTHELGTEYFHWHRYTGYTVAVLVTFRVVWGLVGTKHARFASFLRGPGAVIRYLRSFTRGAPDAMPGHNPAGGWMVVVLLVLLGLQVATGLFANDQIFNTGPFYGWVSGQTSDTLSRLHRRSFDWLLVAVTIHVAVVLVYLVVKKRNLVRPMLTGRKSPEDVSAGDAIEGSRTGWALAIVLVAVGALALAVRLAPQSTISLSF
jgi:cytochrome b